MDCLERGVSLFGLSHQIRDLTDRLVHGVITNVEREAFRRDLIEATNRMVDLSREIEQVQERLKSLGI